MMENVLRYLRLPINYLKQRPFERLATQMQDILGDGGILKKVIQPGDGPPVPRDASVSGNFSDG